MRHFILFLALTLLGLSALAQHQPTSRENDIRLIKAAAAAEYEGRDFDQLEKWLVYALPEEGANAASSHQPAMVFLLRGDEVVTHYYMAYDVDLGVYALTYCGCCHLENVGGRLHAHCETSCTSSPLRTRQQLEKFRPLMRDLSIYK